MKKLALLTFMSVFALSASATWDVTQLMQDMAQQKGGRVRFVEKKYIAILDKPVVSSGELAFIAPDRLEKRTLLPKPELFTLDKDHLEIERGGKKYSLRLSNQPEAVAFADSIRGTLNGNQQLLEANYTLQLSGTPEAWSLRLLPFDPKIAALVSHIDIKGNHNRIITIEYQLADGDRTVMSIEPIETE
ncbi:MAG: LolA-related protein [Georgfuchsia sp.]